MARLQMDNQTAVPVDVGRYPTENTVIRKHFARSTIGLLSARISWEDIL